MWTWIPLFLLESYRTSSQVGALGADRVAILAAGAAFAVIGIGGLGSLLAGHLADRWGRTKTTILSMVMSGTCAIVIGLFFHDHVLMVTAIALVWGFAIVADSAQFSSCISELAESEYMGTHLTTQTSMGFLLTLATIQLVPQAVDWIGWRWAFAPLALGPAFGVWAMWRLGGSPEAAKLAGGRG